MNATLARLTRLREIQNAPLVGAAISVDNVPEAPEIGPLRQLVAQRQAALRRAEASLPGIELADGLKRISTHIPLRETLPSGWPNWLPGAVQPVASQLGASQLGTPVFIDTETTGLAGGTGTLAFLVGIAVAEGGALVIEQFLLTRPGAEAQLYQALAAALPPEPIWVSFNGRSFDMPLLATRQRLKRRVDVFAQRPHWDLLHPLRCAFGAKWDNCRLASAEQRLLGIERHDDLPSAQVPAAYRDWLARGESAALRRVLDHHRQDIASLAALLVALDRVYADPDAYGADPERIERRMARLARARRALN